MTARVIHADCLEALAGLDESSIDAIVTDPPYGLGFMGKHWDHAVPGPAYWQACFRVLKPGGHLLAFAGTRTQHRMACAIEDAGFEIRDMLAWVYGSGFPKGQRVDNSLFFRIKQCLSADSAPHVEQVSPFLNLASQEGREPIALAAAQIQPEGVPALLIQTGRADGSFDLTAMSLSASQQAFIASNTTLSWSAKSVDDFAKVSTSTTETASKTTTVLKTLNSLLSLNTPSFTPRLVTLPNGEQWPAVRVVPSFSGAPAFSQPIPVLTATGPVTWNTLARVKGHNVALKPALEPITLARKPLAGTVAANVQAHGTGALNIDGCRIGFASAADESESKGKNRHADFGTKPGGNQVYGDYSMVERTNYDAPGRWPANLLLDEDGAQPLGEAARYFYVAKPARAERDAGLADMPVKQFVQFQTGNGASGKPSSLSEGRDTQRANLHPTVKPIELMRYLCRLITPPGGTVLDPFLGSGTTGCAAVLEGFSFIGIEREAEYVEIATKRIAAFEGQKGKETAKAVKAIQKAASKPVAAPKTAEKGKAKSKRSKPPQSQLGLDI